MAREPEPDVQANIPIEPPPHQRLYDYYVRPAEPAPSPLHAVAAALAPLSDDLFNLAGQQQKVQNQNAGDQADLDFWNQQGAAQATQQNLVPVQNNRAYMMQWGANAGLNDASKLKQSIGPDYAQFDKTQDPQAFDQWFFSKAKGSADPKLTNNPGYAKAYGNGIARLHEELSNQFTQDSTTAIKSAATTEYTKALGNTINEQWPTGSSPIDSQKLGETLGYIRDRAVASGMDVATANKAVVDMASIAALDHKNSSVLTALQTIRSDPNDPNSAKLSDDEYGRSRILDTTQKVATGDIQQRERDWKISAHQDGAAANDTMSSIVKTWSQGNPNYIASPQEEAVLSRTEQGRSFLKDAAKIREGLITGKQPVDNPQAYADWKAGVLEHGATMADIAHGRAQGFITPKNFNDAVDLVTKVQNYNSKGGANRILEEGTVKQYLTTMTALTGPLPGLRDALGLPLASPEGLKISNDFKEHLLTHALANPNEDPLARQKYIKDLGDALLGGIKDKAFTEPPGVDALGKSAPAAPAAPPAAPVVPGAPANAPAASPEAPGPQKKADATPGSEPWRPAPPARPLGHITVFNANQFLGQLSAPPRFADLPKYGVDQGLIGQLQSAAQAHNMTPQQIIDAAYTNLHPGWKPPEAAPEAPAKEPEAPAVVPGKQGAIEGDTKMADAGAAAQPVSLQIPGGGRIDLHGVSPEVAQQITHMAGLMGRLGSQQQAAPKAGDEGAAIPQEAAPAVSPSRVAQIDAMPETKAVVEKVAKEAGMDPAELKAMVSIESSGRATADTGSYHGLLQLSKQEFAKYGKGGDIHNAEDNLRAGVAAIQDHARKFEAEFGRKPSPTEIYLMHQQGEGGLRAHEENPQGLAWENMHSTAEGQDKGPHWAKLAVWGNVPSDMRHLFPGGVSNMTSAQFMAVWQHKLEGVPYREALARATGNKLAENE